MYIIHYTMYDVHFISAHAVKCISHADSVFSATTSFFFYFLNFFSAKCTHKCNQLTMTACLHVYFFSKVTNCSQTFLWVLKSFSMNAKCVVLHLAWIIWCVLSYDENIRICHYVCSPMNFNLFHFNFLRLKSF